MRLGGDQPRGPVRWVPVRRGVADPADRAHYLWLAPRGAAVNDLAAAAGLRWSVESRFEAGEQEAGLDEHEVRSSVGWYGPVTLSMLAFLTAARAADAGAGGKGHGGRPRRPTRSRSRRSGG